MQDDLPAATEVQTHLEAQAPIQHLAFETQEIVAWDTGLLTFLLQIIEHGQARHIEIDQSGLQEGMRRLIALATAVPEREGAARQTRRTAFFALIGSWLLTALDTAREMLNFLGLITLACLRLASGQARIRWSDLILQIQACGFQALPIVSIIGLLIGLILAFMGAIQLRQFGAQIYVADLVGIGMTREMGAVMTGIIMAGRTGAAFAAQLGTMQVNEEIDALTTLGISPMEFLVLPRMLALILMMPLLCVYADLLGMIGGVIVATSMLDLSLIEYYNETLYAVTLSDFFLGMFKSSIFGVLIAMSGCLRGMQCGRSALAVGEAATSAVVTGIVCIIVSDGLFAIISDIIGL